MKNKWMLPLALLFISAVLFDLALAAPPRIRKVNCSIVEAKPSERVFFYDPSGNEEHLLEFRRTLMDMGATQVNAFLPSHIVCKLPLGIEWNEAASLAGMQYVMDNEMGAIRSDGGLPGIDMLRQCYDRVGAVPVEMEHGLLGHYEDTGERLDEVITIPRAVVERTRKIAMAAPPGEDVRGIDQNSEFMLGDILVNIVLPESDYPGQSETWTDQEMIDAIQGAYLAMLGYQDRFNSMPMHFVFDSYKKVKIGREPIQHNMDTDYLWITDVMLALGYELPLHGSFEDMIHAFNNNTRKRRGADWVITTFTANSQNETDHRFRNASYTAYASLGGPYFVIPYPCGENPNDIDPVLLYSTVYQHEASHNFWALDEYPSAMSGCSNHTGYLNYYNRNKVLRYNDAKQPEPECQKEVKPCIMWAAKSDRGRPICSFTAGQLGLMDANRNSIPDVFDSAPIVEFEGAPRETVMTRDFSVSCKVKSTAVPNKNAYFDEATRIDYAAPLKDAFLNINGAGGIKMIPMDGRWNEMEEDLVISLESMAVGLTTIEITARNSFGIASAPTIKQVYNIGLQYSLFHIDVQNDGIDLSWNMIGETFDASFDLFRAELVGDHADTLLLVENMESYDPGGHFQPFRYYDHDIIPGSKYSYFVRGTFSLSIGGQGNTYVSNSRVVETQAIIPIVPGNLISDVAPNPFRNETTFSLLIPKSFGETASGLSPPPGDVSQIGSASAIRKEVPTAVNVAIYDVLGRRVKAVFTGSLFGQAQTFVWDGTNNSNNPVPSGVYFLKADAGSSSQVRKLVILR